MPSDEALALAVADGDEVAFEALVARYQGPIEAFVRRHVGPADSEDIAQEVWLRMLGAVRRFDPGRRFSTWLFQIAVNLCRDRARRQRTRGESASTEFGRHSGSPTGEASLDDRDSRPEPAGGDDPAARASAAVDAERLLARLSTEHREVVVLRFLLDMSEAEIAEVVGCPQGTVKSRLHHALARLSRFVAGERR